MKLHEHTYNVNIAAVRCENKLKAATQTIRNVNQRNRKPIAIQFCDTHTYLSINSGAIWNFETIFTRISLKLWIEIVIQGIVLKMDSSLLNDGLCRRYVGCVKYDHFVARNLSMIFYSISMWNFYSTVYTLYGILCGHKFESQ